MLRTFEAFVDEHGFGDSHAIKTFVRNALAESCQISVDEMERRISTTSCADLCRRIEVSVHSWSDRLLPDSQLGGGQLSFSVE